MKILVLGGTSFVGRSFVELALPEGHEITLFHRGKTGADLFPSLEHVHGDREHDLGLLGDRTWDAVLDTSGYLPRVVRASVDFLKGKVDRYLFISTISVYKDWATPDKDESGNLQSIDNEDTDELDNSTYGPYKVRCEQAVRNRFGDQATILRPGLIFGPYDPTNRFPYWVERFATQDKVLVPNRLDQPTQQIDARDLGAFTLGCLESHISGTFNVCGGAEQQTLGDLLETCRDILNPQAQMVQASAEFLESNEVDLPLVMPADGSFDGHMRVVNARAIDAGLTFRDWAETTRDTWMWLRIHPITKKRFGMLRKDREQELIAELLAR